MSNSHFNSVTASAGFAAALALLVLAFPARAEDPTFPAGSRIGLVPPSGMLASETFVGFADPGKDAAILITMLPAEAYSRIEKTLDPEVLKKQGVILEKREAIKLDFGKGFLLTCRQVVDKTHYRKWLLAAEASDLTALVTVQIPEHDNAYPDRVVRAALTTLSLRARVPEAEELSLLPFSVGDLAGFHVDGVLRGRALMLSDIPGQTPGDPPHSAFEGGPDAHLMIAAIPGGPTETTDHENFARQSFNEIGGLRGVRVTMSEPLRIGGQSGYQTMAEAKDIRSGTDVMVVQWLRFGGGGFMQMIGIARAEAWPDVFNRMRAVRDSIDPK